MFKKKLKTVYYYYYLYTKKEEYSGKKGAYSGSVGNVVHVSLSLEVLAIG